MAERVEHTLYQVSTATALVEGIYQGAVQIATLREHGDLGLGTFERLEGANGSDREACCIHGGSRRDSHSRREGVVEQWDSCD
jgi:hypothetical protein